MNLPIAIASILLSLTSGCAPAPARAALSASPAVERLVTLEHFERGIDVGVGDLLRVTPPAAYDEWEVTADMRILRPLISRDHLRRPPADGWLFEAAQHGRTVLTLTGIAPAAGANVPRFTLEVRVR